MCEPSYRYKYLVPAVTWRVPSAFVVYPGVTRNLDYARCTDKNPKFDVCGIHEIILRNFEGAKNYLEFDFTNCHSLLLIYL